MKIFLSYRRDDAGGHAGRLADALRARLGPGGVFQDVSAIAPGEDFTVAIDRALDACDAVLAVIGRDWLDASSPEGAPRLQQRGDYVRLELARALQRSVPVVPVLVGRAQLPPAGELPDELAGLVQRQSVVLHDETFHEDVQGLVRKLRGELEPEHARPRRRVVLAAAAVVVIAAGVAVWLITGPDDPSAGDDGDGSLSACAQPGEGWRAIKLAGEPSIRVEDPGPVVYRVERGRYRKRDGGWQVVLGTTLENLTDEAFYNGDYHYPSVIVGKREFENTCYAQESDAGITEGTIGDAVVGFDVRCEPTGYIQLVTDGGRIDVTDPGLGAGPC